MLTAIILMVWIHFIADFIFQADKIAVNKSKNNRILFIHVSIYILPFVPFAVWALRGYDAWTFLLINFAAHFATDYISSRACGKLYAAGERHWFFVVIGLDQAIHMTTLFLTFAWLR